MKYYYSLLAYILLFFSIQTASASVPSDIGFDQYPEGTIVSQASDLTFITVLGYIQAALLRGALPILIVGTSLYIAYELFTAEGDETKMKKAWKSLTFGAIGLVCIGVSYAFISVIASLSL